MYVYTHNHTHTYTHAHAHTPCHVSVRTHSHVPHTHPLTRRTLRHVCAFSVYTRVITIIERLVVWGGRITPGFRFITRHQFTTHGTNNELFQYQLWTQRAATVRVWGGKRMRTCVCASVCMCMCVCVCVCVCHGPGKHAQLRRVGDILVNVVLWAAHACCCEFSQKTPTSQGAHFSISIQNFSLVRWRVLKNTLSFLNVKICGNMSFCILYVSNDVLCR